MVIRRRAVLRGAGIGTVLGAAAACAPAPAPAVPATPTPSPAPASPPDWAALRGRLAGTLVLASEPGYDTARLAYNPLFDDRRPAAIARCATESDVQACLGVAAASRVPVAARSGGHSYAGYSTPQQGLVVDLGAMNTVAVRPDGTAVIGAGTRLIDVYAGLAAAGRCVPGGSCPTVGIAGLALGGGIGVLTNTYGLTCDHLRSATVVTADATLRTVSAASEPDLFWALRGGGGGNAGVVTSFTFSTVPAPALTVFQLGFPAGSLTAVLGGWQRFTTTAPDELWSTLGITAGSPSTCRINGSFVGAPAQLNPLLDALVAATGTRPTARFASAKGYLDAMKYFGGCTSYSVAQCHPSWNGSGALGREGFVATSQIMHTPVADPARLAALFDGRTGLEVLIDSIGGAAARVAPADTAFPHRGAFATVQLYFKTTSDGVGTATRQVSEVRAAMTALLGAGGYVNYIDPQLPDWAEAYYGANLPRLRQVVQRYDPGKVLAFAQGLA